MKEYTRIDTLIDKVIKISSQSGNYYMLGMGYKFLGKYQIESANDKMGSVVSFKAALENMIKAGNDYEIAAVNQNLGYSYFLTGNNEQAVYYYKVAIEQSKKLELPQIEQYSLKNLSELEEKRKIFLLHWAI
ncbi:MAG: hypothetical protein IPI98_04310 [Chitinophagaceae bacterium]|nr:hypothetical protein [Chitinophagaceae bacterium]